MNTKPLTLVLGATGKTGSRVAARLQAKGFPVRAGSRSASPSFDWHQPQTWAAALEGVDQAYITFYPDLAIPGAHDAISAFVDAAVSSGVKRLVLLSGRGEDAARACERLVQSSGVEHTIVRASFFAQNFSEGPFAGAIAGGVFAMPTHGAREPFIDVDDIADVVTAALTEPGHNGELYEVTGPRLLDFPTVIAEINAATGKDVKFLEVPQAAYKAGLINAGLPDDYASFLTELFSTVLDGRNEYTTDGVQRALGREPKDFSAFVRETVASGAWEVRS